MERKKVIQHIRGLYKTDLSASRHWQELVQQLTHDRWASKLISHKGLRNIGTECNNKIIIMVMIVIGIIDSSSCHFFKKRKMTI